MTKTEKLEQEIKKLNPNELSAFREWFQNYDSEVWDNQIEDDIKKGKLEQLANKAIEEHKSGRTKEI